MYNETRFDVVDRFTPLNLILDQNVVYIKMLRKIIQVCRLLRKNHILYDVLLIH